MSQFLWVSGWMLVGLCAVNLLLFRRDGVDFWLALALVGAVGCLLYRWLRGVMHILKWLWVALAAAGWLATLFLAYHMGLALWVGRGEPVIPAHLQWKTPNPQLAANYEKLVERYPHEREPDPTLKDLAALLLDSAAPAAEWEALLNGGELAAKLKAAEPPLHEALEFYAAHPYQVPEANYFTDLGRPSSLNRRYVAQSAWLEIMYLQHQGRTREAQDCYIRLLRTTANGAMPGNSLLTVMIEAAVQLLAVGNQTRLEPDLTRGREAEIIPLLTNYRERLPAQFEQVFASDLELLRSGALAAEERTIIDFEFPQLVEEPAMFFLVLLAADAADRLAYWPFYVR